MMKAIIIDDEQDARYLLRKALLKDFDKAVEIIAEAEDCSSGLEILKTQHPDVVFLDIQMPDGTGFDLLTQLKDIPFQIVFITAFDKFAIQAFEFSAVGYLMKPLNPKLLQATVQRLLKSKTKDTFSGIKVLIENYNSGTIKKIVVPHADGFTIVPLEEIIFINSERNYSQFNLVNGKKLLTSKTLALYDKMLVDQGFFRIHQSYLINLTHVKSYVRSAGGVQMSSGELLPIARHRKAEIMERFIS
jgi:two-component system LytT family response regulator